MDTDFTIVEHIEAAIRQTDDHQASGAGQAWGYALGRGIERLEEARMWITRGLAEKQGVFQPADLEKDVSRT